MKRDTMIAWIQSCSHCGYCSTNIDDEDGVRTQFRTKNGKEMYCRNYANLLWNHPSIKNNSNQILIQH